MRCASPKDDVGVQDFASLPDMEEWERDNPHALSREGCAVDRAKARQNISVTDLLSLLKVALRRFHQSEVENRGTAAAVGVCVELLTAHLRLDRSVGVQSPSLVEARRPVLSGTGRCERNGF